MLGSQLQKVIYLNLQLWNGFHSTKSCHYEQLLLIVWFQICFPKKISNDCLL